MSAAIHAAETATGHEAHDTEVAKHPGPHPWPEYHDTLHDLRGQKLLSLDESSPDGTHEVEQIPPRW
ncbi:MAG: hypothetical protein IPL99_22295 [Candidatus Competibacteraceae bacterium]|nr:hypothetical protein [Candidatus Competibacteraceae bacterium]